MVLLRCLAVAVALSYEVIASPCRPSSSSIVTSSRVLEDDLASSTTLTTLSSGDLGAKTVSSPLEAFTSVDSTLEQSSDITSTASTDSFDPTWTSVALTFIEASSNDPTTDGASTTTMLSSETAAGQTTLSTSDIESLTTGDVIFAGLTTSDASTMSMETSSLVTEGTETFISHSSSNTEATSSIATSEGASTDTTISETSTAEPSIAETTTTKQSTKTGQEPTTTSTTSAERNGPTNYFVNGGFEIPDDNGDYTGAPSLLGRILTVKNNPSRALSGSHYAELPYVSTGGVPPYAFRQSLTGLDPAKRYAYSYSWAPTDIVISNPGNAYLKFTTFIGSSPSEFEVKGEVGSADLYVKRKIVFGGLTTQAPEFVQTRIQFVGISSVTVLLDDISIFEYDPPCTIVSPAPSDKWCGPKGSTYGIYNPEKMIGTMQWTSLEDCAQSCQQEPACKLISYVRGNGNNNGQCYRMKVPREDVEFYENSGGHYVYEMECFEFE